MPSSALQALRRKVTIDWPQQIQTDGKALLLRAAREGHARIMREQTARAGVIPEFDAYANNPGNDNLDSVRLPGPIVYRYRYRREVMLAAKELLEKGSPVDSGAYKRSHARYDDRQPTSWNAPMRPGVSILISNPVPYARRLEIGKTESGRNFLISKPNRLYERTAKQLQARYRNVAKITFGFVTLPGAHVIKGGLGASYSAGGRRRQRRQRKGSEAPSPAIFIEMIS